MTFGIDRDKTELFTVVGAPYVAEQHHADGESHFQAEHDKPETNTDTGIAGLWVVFYVVIAIAGLVSSGSVGRAIDYAVAMLK